LDLLVDPADRLDLAALVDRTGNGERLRDRCLGERRQQGEEFGGRGAVAVDAAIGLFENEAGVQRQGPVEAKAAAQKAGKDQDPFRMQGSAERDFALNVDDLAAAQAHPRGDAARDTKGGPPESSDKPIAAPSVSTRVDFFAISSRRRR